jgi:hypothetical protein
LQQVCPTFCSIEAANCDAAGVNYIPKDDVQNFAHILVNIEARGLTHHASKILL